VLDTRMPRHNSGLDRSSNQTYDLNRRLIKRRCVGK
jgi:hypothetical protein